MQGTLASLVVYPIKSAGGIELDSARVAAHGLEFDRRWMLIDETGEFVSQRTVSRMALLRVEIGTDKLIVRAPGQPVLTLALRPKMGERVEARIWGDVCAGLAVDVAADAWFTDVLGIPVRLVHLPEPALRTVDQEYAEPTDRVGFADDFPFLLTSESSLANLNARSGTRFPMNRFRPNLVVTGFDAFAEDDWQRIRIGEVAFRVAKPCARCVVVTIDQQTGEAGDLSREPLRTLASFRRVNGKVMFGQNLIQDGAGVVRVGDRVTIERTAMQGEGEGSRS